jgi:2-iminobutanoate/2-iminopropanoate deaminase
MRIVHSPKAPPANGHYSHAIVHGNTVYVSGQLGRGPTMADEQAGDITVQTKRALESLREILLASGSDMQHLLKVTLYIADIALWPAVDAAYRAAMKDHKPARAVVPTLPLHFGALIEIEGVAAVAGDA